MRHSLMLASLACSMFLTTPALAASVRVRASASTHVSTDENGTLQQSEAQVEGNGASVRVRTSGPAGDVSIQRSSNEVRTTTCATGESCTVRTESTQNRGNTTVTASLSSRNWWNSWRQKLLNALRGTEVASQQVDEGDARASLNRQQVRLAYRICGKFEQSDRDGCLEDALEGDGTTMRTRLRAWIDRL